MPRFSLAALALPRRVVIAGSVTGGGKALGESEMQTAFRVTKQIAEIAGQSSAVTISANADGLPQRRRETPVGSGGKRGLRGRITGRKSPPAEGEPQRPCQ